MQTKSAIRDQAIALFLTVTTCGALIALLWGEIHLLNIFTSDDISLSIHWSDVLIGMTIYLKTAIDFAIFIGRLMDKNKGLKGRIGIEIGTALGNAVGTMAILLIWTFFKEVTWLLAIMVFVAGLVLFRLAEDGMEHIDAQNQSYPKLFRRFILGFEAMLQKINGLFGPLLNKLIPSRSLKVEKSTTFKALLVVSFTVPFILGLDDFAGYVPLFNIVNVFGFSIGVFTGHMVLNILLYLFPKRTIATVKNPIISFLGSIAFFGLAVWGIVEAIKLITGHH